MLNAKHEGKEIFPDDIDYENVNIFGLKCIGASLINISCISYIIEMKFI